MKIITLLCFAFAFHSASALAEPSEPGAQSETDLTQEPAWATVPFRLYGGAATGYGNVSGSEFAQAPDGPQALLDADLSYYLHDWVLEAGAGWMYSRLDGSHADSTSLSIRTRTGFGDASIRYRLSQHWQLGPAYNLEFGTDTGFGPGVAGSAATSLLGLRVVYEFGLGNFPFRVIGQGMTAVGDPGRNYVLATLGFQIGLPLDFGSKKSEEVAETPIVLQAAAPVEAPVEEVRISLDPRKVFFSTNSSRLRPGVKNALGDIAAYLAANESDWAKLDLSGHADQRGRAEYNVKLSQKRANSVRSALIGSGVDQSKVQTEAFGFYHLADPNNNIHAWSKNRRVELVFQGVKDPQALREKIQELAEYESQETR